MRLLTIFALKAIFLCSIHATTIVPFPNLGEMAAASEVVVLARCVRNYTIDQNGWTRFRTQFDTRRIVSGAINPSFSTQDLHLKYDDLERTILGDVSFEPGTVYLLFLDKDQDGNWRAKMLSHGIFQQYDEASVAYLVPVEDALNLEIVEAADGIPREPFHIYRRDALLDLIENTVQGRAVWDHRVAKASLKRSHFETGRAAPNHCTFFANSAPYPHWQDLGSTPLPVRYHSGGDNGCSSVSSLVGSAISIMQNNYSGVNIVNQGTHTYAPSTCSGGAHGNNFVNWVNSNLGSTRNILIQFDDPCNELGNLNGCSGVLAHGGIYWSGSTHSENGQTYKNAMYGYVTVNNGVGSCYCGNTYRDMLVHELTHTLGIGHIGSGNGAANMNPSNPSGVTNLDRQCLDWFYPPVNNGPCDPVVTMNNLTISVTEQINASQQISLTNVTLTSNADVTIMAPQVSLNQSCTINLGAELTIMNQAGCN